VARGTFTVVAWPRVAVVAFGGSVAVNCSRSPCPDGDNVTLGLETPVGATPGPGGLLWKSFRLENVSLWNPGDVTCAGRCGDSEDRDSVGVIVYQPPQRVTLDPVTPVAVGDSVTLRCHVLEVAPVRNLTVTLRRGAETLRTETFGDGDDDGGSASVAVSHLLTVTRGDHGQDVTCHAELSLRPHGPLFARAAVPVTLSVFALPEPPQLLSPSILEAGTVTNVTCVVTGAFPAGDVVVTAALDREPLDVTVGVAGDTVTATAAVAPGRTGERELSCAARVAAVTRTARRWLRVYSFPEPTLELSPPTAPEGTEVTVTCRAGDTEPPPMALLRDVTGVTPAQGHQAGLQLRVVARRDGDRFWCRATIELGDKEVTKEVTARLDVLYPPELPPSACPASRTWLRGSVAALSCRATGNPVPVVTCGRRGVTEATPEVTAEPLPVTRDRAGTYVCKATNALGTRSRRVTVRVEYPPSLSESGCPSRRVWLEGQRRQLECHGDGDPPPRTRCHRDGDTRRGDIGDSGTHHGDTGDGGTQRGDIHGGGGIQRSDTDDGGTQHGDTRNVTRHGDIRGGGTHHGDARDGDTRDVTRHSDTHLGDSRDDTHQGSVTRGGGRVVTRADGGRYVCRATNRHGVALRSVIVTVESPPRLSERGCPERRRWLEGSPARLSCAASGNPPPRVTCHRLGDKSHPRDVIGMGDRPRDVTGPGDHPHVTRNVTRGDAGLYRCRATNAHGAAVRNVTVSVEYPPSAVTLRVLPAAEVSRGVTVTVTCGSRGVPGVTFTWSHPGAANLRLSRDNSSVIVTGVTAANRGLYTCTATNRHGHSTGSVTLTVDESWLVALVALGTVGGVTALALAAAGVFYLKTTACKKGEYNVRDAEGSSEATCLHRGDNGDEVFGIQLTQT
ncbi:LOW QUALITY PROTEIN: intercellular adhesion molecule 5, partial [Chamaea fasciata]|uniref:LOW QUALITY PROTEIN: intercellular adhesion molecule 5 n=1 Tax=Chamaea fasciata TaxID=190680 RepID=UPI00336A8B8C